MRSIIKIIAFVLFILFLSFNFSFSQSSAHLKIANAKLTISFKGKIANCITNENGEFAISLSDTSKTFLDATIQTASIKVELPQDFKGKVKNRSLIVQLKKENAPYYEFILYSKKGKEPIDEVELVCEQIEKNQTKSQPQKKNEIKRGKGDASKIGDKYMGQVAHF